MRESGTQTKRHLESATELGSPPFGMLPDFVLLRKRSAPVCLEPEAGLSGKPTGSVKRLSPIGSSIGRRASPCTFLNSRWDMSNLGIRPKSGSNRNPKTNMPGIFCWGTSFVGSMQREANRKPTNSWRVPFLGTPVLSYPKVLIMEWYTL